MHKRLNEMLLIVTFEIISNYFWKWEREKRSYIILFQIIQAKSLLFFPHFPTCFFLCNHLISIYPSLSLSDNFFPFICQMPDHFRRLTSNRTTWRVVPRNFDETIGIVGCLLESGENFALNDAVVEIKKSRKIVANQWYFKRLAKIFLFLLNRVAFLFLKILKDPFFF